MSMPDRICYNLDSVFTIGVDCANEGQTPAVEWLISILKMLTWPQRSNLLVASIMIADMLPQLPSQRVLLQSLSFPGSEYS